MSAAIMTAYSTDHSRALSGAEWLQQLASELVEAIKAEQFKPLADAFDEQAGPGDGWRWLEPGEAIGNEDMVTAGNGDFSITSVAGYKVAPGQYRCYRTKI